MYRYHTQLSEMLSLVDASSQSLKPRGFRDACLVLCVSFRAVENPDRQTDGRTDGGKSESGLK